MNKLRIGIIPQREPVFGFEYNFEIENFPQGQRKVKQMVSNPIYVEE